MEKNIYKMINNDYNDFKNNFLLYAFDIEIKKFINQNNLISNIAQQDELIKIFKKCKNFGFLELNEFFESTILNEEFLRKVLKRFFSGDKVNYFVIEKLTEIIYKIYFENKDLLITSDTNQAKNFVDFKNNLELLNNLQLKNNLEELITNSAFLIKNLKLKNLNLTLLTLKSIHKLLE